METLDWIAKKRRYSTRNEGKNAEVTEKPDDCVTIASGFSVCIILVLRNIITRIIHIDAANRHGIAMPATLERCFLH